MGVQIEQLKTSEFFLFYKKKTKLLFFKFSPTFWVFFFGYKKNPEISLE